MTFVFLYLVPFILTMLLVPKCLAAHSERQGRKFNIKTPVIQKDVYTALIVAVIPVVNIFTIFITFACYLMELPNLIPNEGRFQKPLFPKKDKDRPQLQRRSSLNSEWEEF